MSYLIEINESDGVLSFKTTGSIHSVEEFMKRVDDVTTAVKRTGCKNLLFDNRKLIISLDTMDSCQIGSMLENRQVAALGVRAACVFADFNAEFYKRLETIYTNRSISYRVFDDKNAALQWLKA